MDEQVRWEAQTLDPDIGFHATTGHRHATWAQTWHSRPELYIQPAGTAEIRKAVQLARRCRRHVVVVGAGHSPSDLTCTSSWMLNLDRHSRLLSADRATGVVTLQAGMRLFQAQAVLRDLGLALPNAGSITDQSIAGAIATGTHGSSLRHGLLSDNVLALKLVLADGSVRHCTREKDADLFRAALLSLGALGVVAEVTLRAVPDFKIEWKQRLVDLRHVINSWDDGLWTDHEFVRVWWMPYMKKCIHWHADKTDRPLTQMPKKSSFSRNLAYHFYQTALYIANWIPFITPWIERIVGRIQYGSTGDGGEESAVQWSRDGLQMDCLYSQFVNEWAIPLERGPEALTRLSAWIHREEGGGGIPVDARGVYVHAPVEVRVADGRRNMGPRAFLDPTRPDGPTLYLNATLYRPYHCDPPATAKYYRAFELLMLELGGRPHWAKNFYFSSSSSQARGSGAAPAVASLYPADDVDSWLRARDEVDPHGMFFGDWHRRNLLPSSSSSSSSPSSSAAAPAAATSGSGDSTPTEKQGSLSGGDAAFSSSFVAAGASSASSMPLEERLWASSTNTARGGRNYFGEMAAGRGGNNNNNNNNDGNNVIGGIGGIIGRSSSSNISTGSSGILANSPSASEGSFEIMDHGDAEMSVMLDSKFIGDE